MPRFSIVIPTLFRPDTLEHALSTALTQTSDDVEIIVQNNGDDPAVEMLVQKLADPRIRYFASARTLTMADNWEVALTHATGEFITFIGDDDGILPEACRLAGDVAELAGVEILSWMPACYYWPQYLRAELRNRLLAAVDYRPNVEIVSSVDTLTDLYRFASHYSRLPMIYNSFIRHTVIDRVRQDLGRYFLGRSPDVTSGIVDAAYTAHFARLSQPLSVTGLSHHSTGHRAFLAERGHFTADDLERDFGTVRLDDRLVPSANLQLFIADDMLHVRDRVAALQDVKFDYYRLIQSVANAINDRPGDYPLTVATIAALAARHGIDLNTVAIPPPLTARAPLPSGTNIVGPDRVRFTIDGSVIPLANVGDAVRLMQQLVPTITDTCAIEIKKPQQSPRGLTVRLGETVNFGFGGNGVPSLINGWGDPETWGTWSVAKRAEVRFTFDPIDRQPIRFKLCYRAFLHQEPLRFVVVCRHDGYEVAAWTCTNGNSGQIQPLTIPWEQLGADGTIELEFLVFDPHSPAQFGLNADQRLLGIGVESLTILR